jgi:septal ring factor EnvC (AmiA/AmiB activator)
MKDAHDTTTMGSLEKVIDATQLEQLSRSGWSVVERFDEDEVVQLTETALPPNTQNYYHGSEIILRKDAVARRSFFRMARDRSDVVAELDAQLAKLRSDLASAETNRKQQDARIEQLTTNVSRLQGDANVAGQRADEVSRQLREANAVKTKLERDIGKLREHIGRQSFDQILGSGS